MLCHNVLDGHPMKQLAFSVKTLFLITTAIATLFAGLMLVGRQADRWLGGEDLIRFEEIELGMTKQEVLERLGPPDVSYERSSVPPNYYVGGYSYKDRPINREVFIYIGVEPIAYYYLNNDLLVEDIYIGGS